MIVDTVTKRSRPAISSDHWHVVRAHWSGTPESSSRFTRSIVSEHESREESVAAAKALAVSLALEGAAWPADERDSVFVRRPNFKSLRFARTRTPKRR